MLASSTPSVIVRLSDFGDSDRVVTMMTLAHGKLSALARGARKSQKRFGGLTLFAIGEATVVERPRASLDLLDGFHAARGLPHIVDDMARIAHAGYACELIDGLLPARQPEPGVFRGLIEFLGGLDEQGATAARLRAFELHLLALVGLAPTLNHCLGCGRTELDGPGQLFDARRGGVLCGRCDSAAAGSATPLDGAARRALCEAQSATPSVNPAAPAPAEVDRACRAALTQLVTEHLGHMPRSLIFIAKLNRASRD